MTLEDSGKPDFIPPATSRVLEKFRPPGFHGRFTTNDAFKAALCDSRVSDHTLPGPAIQIAALLAELGKLPRDPGHDVIARYQLTKDKAQAGSYNRDFALAIAGIGTLIGMEIEVNDTEGYTTSDSEIDTSRISRELHTIITENNIELPEILKDRIKHLPEKPRKRGENLRRHIKDLLSKKSNPTTEPDFHLEIAKEGLGIGSGSGHYKISLLKPQT